MDKKMKNTTAAKVLAGILVALMIFGVVAGALVLFI